MNRQLDHNRPDRDESDTKRTKYDEFNTTTATGRIPRYPKPPQQLSEIQKQQSPPPLSHKQNVVHRFVDSVPRSDIYSKLTHIQIDYSKASTRQLDLMAKEFDRIHECYELIIHAKDDRYVEMDWKNLQTALTALRVACSELDKEIGYTQQRISDYMSRIDKKHYEYSAEILKGVFQGGFMGATTTMIHFLHQAELYYSFCDELILCTSFPKYDGHRVRESTDIGSK